LIDVGIIPPRSELPHAVIEPSALRAAKAYDGSITAWGDSRLGGTGAPSDNGYTKIYSTDSAFAALKADGSITSALRAAKAYAVE
jgi:hypothetical protein